MTATRMRISYTKLNESQIKFSRENFVTNNGRLVNVVLNLGAMTYQVNDAESGETLLSGGNTKNRMVLMRKAKAALQSLGVDVGNEVRNLNGLASAEDSKAKFDAELDGL